MSLPTENHAAQLVEKSWSWLKLAANLAPRGASLALSNPKVLNNYKRYSTVAHTYFENTSLSLPYRELSVFLSWRRIQMGVVYVSTTDLASAQPQTRSAHPRNHSHNSVLGLCPGFADPPHSPLGVAGPLMLRGQLWL